MSKFKIGDKVRVVYKNHPDTGKICTVIGFNQYKHILTDLGHNWRLDSSLELVTDYQPITPKVGEKYRVLKELQSNVNETWTVGNVVFVKEIGANNIALSWKENLHLWTKEKGQFTTEYLELVEKPERKVEVTDLYYEAFGISKVDITNLKNGSTVKMEPIKKTLIEKTMNAFKKAMLDADTKTLIKAGYLDEESLELTLKGNSTLTFILFEANKKELVEAAKADTKEQEAKK